VRDGEVIIVDEFTGRTLQGRRWSDGLHQAVEAKESVQIQQENQTLASITFQNYFRMYGKLAGMTGTADTEAYEFQSIYGLEVIVIPTNKPVQRKDYPDAVFLNRPGKYRAVVNEIKAANAKGQPVLVGTTSIEVSELLGQQLTEAGIPHEVLNAKQHEREAHIVAQAGAAKSVTIATNMAGRGTDIVLGGNLEADLQVLGEDADAAAVAQAKADWQVRHDQVVALGGLHIIGTERHESRRIDNQLRGRSGRQGDPGSSRFYLSLEDNLMRIFAADWVQTAMRRMGMKEDEVIESALVSRQIQNAQRKVEAHNFDMRKNLLEYDDVANDQRKVIYQQRNELLEADDVAETVAAIREDVVDEQVRKFVPRDSIDEQWDLPGLEQSLLELFSVRVDLQGLHAGTEELDDHAIAKAVQDKVAEHFASKEAQIGQDMARQLEKHIMLNVLDQTWKEHLARMDYLRQGIHLRGYAQKQPKQEYKRESFELFSEMLEKVKLDVITMLARVRIRDEDEVAAMEEADRLRHEQQALQMNFQHPSVGSVGADEELGEMGMIKSATGPKVGRNDPCPCGSGKKFKQCHGQLT
jgi:preprotein translocase subunit SecA